MPSMEEKQHKNALPTAENSDVPTRLEVIEECTTDESPPTASKMDHQQEEPGGRE